MPKRPPVATRLSVALVSACAVIFTAATAQAQNELRVAGWNLESGGASIRTMTGYLRNASTPPTVHIWGFSEVQSDWVDDIERALDQHGSFELIVGTTGGADRLVIAYDADEFDLIAHGELEYVLVGRRVRAPLWARVRHRASGRSFIFMVNHLYRGDEDTEGDRHRQATLLNRWAARLSVPVIAVGDYNFDWDVDDGENDHDQGYDNLVENGTFTWVRPPDLRRTQCGSSFQSVLDFVFVSGAAQEWGGTSAIETSHAAFCPDDRDDARSSDHRPVLGMFP